MRVVVGLGNPGTEYARTRHNIGFVIIDSLLGRFGNGSPKTRFKSQIADAIVGGNRCVLVKPQTYMNLSGDAVQRIVDWYKLDVCDLLIVTDEIDLPFGTLRLRERGSGGGHNGLTSVIAAMGTTNIPRLRVGIGRGRSQARSHVLSRFSEEENRELPAIVDRAVAGIVLWTSDGAIAAMNQINQSLEPASGESEVEERGD